jgi:hypothetical protein
MSAFDINHPLLRALLPARPDLRGTEGQVILRQDQVMSMASRYGKTHMTMQFMFLMEQAGIKTGFASDWQRKEYETKWKPTFMQQALLLKLQELAKQVYQRRIQRVSKALINIGRIPTVLAEITAQYQVEPPDPHMNSAVALQQWLDTSISRHKRTCRLYDPGKPNSPCVYPTIHFTDSFDDRKPINLFSR